MTNKDERESSRGKIGFSSFVCLCVRSSVFLGKFNEHPCKVVFSPSWKNLVRAGFYPANPSHLFFLFPFLHDIINDHLPEYVIHKKKKERKRKKEIYGIYEDVCNIQTVSA